MADKRDYYEVLGISKGADDAEIKKAFRAMAKKYHPDAHPGDKECEEKFKEAQEAYAVLSDPEKRRQYDQFGHAAFDGGAGGAGINITPIAFIVCEQNNVRVLPMVSTPDTINQMANMVPDVIGKITGLIASKKEKQ